MELHGSGILPAEGIAGDDVGRVTGCGRGLGLDGYEMRLARGRGRSGRGLVFGLVWPGFVVGIGRGKAKDTVEIVHGGS